MKLFKLATIYLTVFGLVTALFAVPVYSSEIIKLPQSVPPGEPFFPGSEVKITIEIPGEEFELRNPTDTVLVMDRTGSMSSFWSDPPVRKLSSAKNALNAFVDETREDAGLGSPGDYVGLVTYYTSATLNFPIANMTPANKTAIKGAIDSITTTGATSIGRGMDLANRELLNLVQPLSTTRPGVPKFMVLATDGIQNTAPSPYQSSILQTAIDNDIIIFTVGIGNDVRTPMTIGGGCIGCPDLDGDGRTSGEEILKDIACKTDSICTDPLTAAHYFFAPNDDELADIYEEIALLISFIAPYMVLDKINVEVFQSNIHDFEATDCDTGDPWPLGETLVGDDAFIVLLEDVPADEVVCISFKVNIRDDATFINSLGSGELFKVDDDVFRLAAVWDPDQKCDTNGNGMLDGTELEDCFAIKLGLPFREIKNVEIFVTGPVKPWLKTTGGNVGSRDKIDMKRDLIIHPLPHGEFHAEYLVILDEGESIIDDNFTSAKKWLVEDYEGNINIHLEPVGGSMYQALFEKYSPKGTTPVDLSSPNTVMANVISSAVGSEGGILIWDSDAVFRDPAQYTGKPAVVFIDGNLTIEERVRIKRDTGLVFIVNGNVLVEGGSANPKDELELVRDDLQQIVLDNPGPLADKLEDAVQEVDAALDALNEVPPNNVVAVDKIDAAIVKIQEAIDEGLFTDPVEGQAFIDRLQGIADQIQGGGGGSRVTRIDGFYIANGEFKSRSNYATEDRQLTINGSVISFDGINWQSGIFGDGRDLGLDCSGASKCNLEDPAEIINYQPRYYWLFRTILGDTNTTFTEVAP